jgi:hypothetical protein
LEEAVGFFVFDDDDVVIVVVVAVGECELMMNKSLREEVDLDFI